MKALRACAVSLVLGGKAALAMNLRSRPDVASEAPAATKPILAGVSNEVAAWEPAPLNATEVFAADTRRPGSWPMEGVPGKHFVNYAAGKKWQGWITKTDGWLNAAREQAAKNPDGVMILLDTDVLNGGCSDQLLFERYAKTVRASGGAPVVVGADLHSSPKVDGHLARFMGEEMQARRTAVLAEFNMTPSGIDRFGMADTSLNFGYVSFSFVNGGFIMGPARLVEEVVRCAQQSGWSSNNWGSGDFNDQRGLAVCAVAHPDKITIDYSGSLCMSTFSFKTGFLHGTPTGIMNSLLGDQVPQCFVHLNGASALEGRQWEAWKLSLPLFTR